MSTPTYAIYLEYSRYYSQNRIQTFWYSDSKVLTSNSVPKLEKIIREDIQPGDSYEMVKIVQLVDVPNGKNYASPRY